MFIGIRVVFLTALICSAVLGQKIDSEGGMIDGDFPDSEPNIFQADTKEMVFKRIEEAFKMKHKVLILCELESCAYSHTATKHFKKMFKSDASLDKYSLIRIGSKQSDFCRSVLNTTTYPAVFYVQQNFKTRRIRYETGQQLHRDVFEEAKVYYDLHAGQNLVSSIVARLKSVVKRYQTLFQGHPTFAVLSLALLFQALACCWWFSCWLVDLLLPLPQSFDPRFESSSISG